MEVTPFLNQLKKVSLFYKLRAIYVRGSADADFTVLTGSMPSPDVVTYQLKTYPYGHECLPHLAAASGYDVVSLHGNAGTFFNRREAFVKMGFHTCYFLEELLEAGLPRGRWGIEDARVLKFSGDLFSNTERPALHFIITLTSHGPFTYLTEENGALFKPPSTLEERYLNSMNYVDRAMDEYVKELPDRTLCIIYGDHNAHFDFSGRKRPGQPDYVPCLIYRKGEDLSGLLEKEDRKTALSGAMDFIDLNDYLTRLLPASETVSRRPAPPRDN
jgi:phosphoglycerol transferase MdoB-like AlkP superfamily enzyme